MNLPEQIRPQPPKSLKWGLSICTIIYIVISPFLFYMALLSAMVSDNPNITPFMVGVVMCIMFLIPLSIPVSIYFMWSRYFRNQPSKALIFAGLPFYTLTAVFFTFSLLEALILNR